MVSHWDGLIMCCLTRIFFNHNNDKVITWVINELPSHRLEARSFHTMQRTPASPFDYPISIDWMLMYLITLKSSLCIITTLIVCRLVHRWPEPKPNISNITKILSMLLDYFLWQVLPTVIVGFNMYNGVVSICLSKTFEDQLQLRDREWDLVELNLLASYPNIIICRTYWDGKHSQSFPNSATPTAAGKRVQWHIKRWEYGYSFNRGKVKLYLLCMFRQSWSIWLNTTKIS